MSLTMASELTDCVTVAARSHLSLLLIDLDPTADGEHGYKVYFRDLNRGADDAVLTQRVVLSAGALGSTEMLLRCRDYFQTLPRISNKALGENYSGNGDFLLFALDTEKPINPNYVSGHHPAHRLQPV